MGALTLKSFPFELRGWDIEKFESIDPTDGFGTQTRVYISKNQVVQIEPDYDTQTSNTWLSDKGRQFFDEIFEAWEVNQDKMNLPKNSSWPVLINSLLKTLYIFDHCNKNSSKNYFFTIVFENLSIEMLSLLLIISKNYSFLKIRRAENVKLTNDFETNFQLNSTTEKIKLKSSTLCLLVSTNPRYESYFMNLSLRQRLLKGNFKCFSIGSFLNLTFPVSFLGSNLNTIKTIANGNNFICQDLKNAKNPILISNMELSKRVDGRNIADIFKILKYNNIFHKTWNGINTLNPSLAETGIHMISNFSPISSTDLTNFSSLYLLNVDMYNITNVKKIVQLKLLEISIYNKTNTESQNLLIDQSHRLDNNFQFYNEAKLKNYRYLPQSMFYENDETFVNTQGFTKRTTKLIFRKKAKNSWQILRRMFKHLGQNLTFINDRDNSQVFFNSKRIVNFRNYINFHYCATQNLTNLNFYLITKNRPYILTKSTFKKKNKKIKNTKLQYWINDFFGGGKDSYSHSSLTMTSCSKILRSEGTNFF